MRAILVANGGLTMSNPYGWKSCGGSYGANLAARQQAGAGNTGSGGNGPKNSGGGGSSPGSEFFGLIFFAGLLGWIANSFWEGKGIVVGIAVFIFMFIMWVRKNKAEARYYSRRRDE